MRQNEEIEENQKILVDKQKEIEIEEKKDQQYDETIEILMNYDPILKYCIENNNNHAKLNQESVSSILQQLRAQI